MIQRPSHLAPTEGPGQPSLSRWPSSVGLGCPWSDGPKPPGGRGVSFPEPLRRSVPSACPLGTTRRPRKRGGCYGRRPGVGLSKLEDERWDELEQLHALRRRLLDHEGDPRYKPALQAVEQLIDERGADPDCRQG
jgi:hypothetical protein